MTTTTATWQLATYEEAASIIAKVDEACGMGTDSRVLNPERYDFWLLGDVGYAAFTVRERSDERELRYAYLMPEAQRQGHLSAGWKVWDQEYTQFCVWNPSDAMQAFLAKHDYAPEDAYEGDVWGYVYPDDELDNENSDWYQEDES